MTTDARVLDPAEPVVARIVGLGSIYGKTVRDSRRAALVVGGVAALFMIGTGAPYGFAPGVLDGRAPPGSSSPA